jgi:hypothetical protein
MLEEIKQIAEWVNTPDILPENPTFGDCLVKALSQTAKDIIKLFVAGVYHLFVGAGVVIDEQEQTANN